MFSHVPTGLLAVKFVFKKGYGCRQVHLLASVGHVHFWQGLAYVCNRLQQLKMRLSPVHEF
jgi:hypothetical protein